MRLGYYSFFNTALIVDLLEAIWLRLLISFRYGRSYEEVGQGRNHTRRVHLLSNRLVADLTLVLTASECQTAHKVHSNPRTGASQFPYTFLVECVARVPLEWLIDIWGFTIREMQSRWGHMSTIPLADDLYPHRFALCGSIRIKSWRH